MSETVLDKWITWSLTDSNADPSVQHTRDEYLSGICDTILNRAFITPTDIVLDVGTGTGLVGFRALEKLHPSGRVIFVDISFDCIEHCRIVAEKIGRLDSVQFHNASIETLNGIGDESVDVVAFRSVLSYAADKRSAMRSIYRVLKPGGRVSFFEPINSFAFTDTPSSLRGYDMGPIANIARRVIDALRNGTHAALTNSMIDFDERDLFSMVDEVGFGSIDMEYHALTAGSVELSFESWFESKPNPNAISVRTAVDRALSGDDVDRFITYMREQVSNGRKIRKASVFLNAFKSGTSLA